MLVKLQNQCGITDSKNMSRNDIFKNSPNNYHYKIHLKYITWNFKVYGLPNNYELLKLDKMKIVFFHQKFVIQN